MFFAETPKKETATRASCTQEEAKRCFRGGLTLGVHKIPFRVFSSYNVLWEVISSDEK